MRVLDDRNAAATKGLRGPSRRHTATILTLPMSWNHTVRSVAQEALKTLWADEPDRAERWRRIGNMEQLYGVGRPLRTITKDVIAAVYREMLDLRMPGDVITRHLEDFATLMFWADAHGFVRWSRSDITTSVDD